METTIVVQRNRGPYGLSIYTVRSTGEVFYGNVNGAFDTSGRKLAASVFTYIKTLEIK